MTTAGRAITVVVIEDHPAIAQGIAALLADETDIAIVGIATDVVSATAILEAERPTVALCDLMLHGIPAGFGLLQRFGGTDGTAFVMFSAYSFPRFYARAVQLGAAAYVLKTASIEEILDAIRRAATGQASPLSETLRQARSAERAPAAREFEIVRLVAEGRSNKEIATTMAVSIKTIESRLRLLFDRYDIRSRSELAALALHEGWLPEGDLP